MDKKIVGIVVGVCALLVVVGVVIGGQNAKDLPPVSGDQSTKVDMKITNSDWIKGKETAPVTLVEFADFQCPACGAYHEVIKQLVSEMPDQVRVVFRHYPLTSIHDKAWIAAKASEAAGKQNKFWEMYEELFTNQQSWAEKSPKDFSILLEGYAKKIGVDVTKFKTDINSPEVEAAVKADADFGDELGIRGTPSFYINGVYNQLPGSYEKFKEILVNEAAKNPAPTKAPQTKVHEHFDFAYFVNGKKVNLNLAVFNELNPDIHIHDANGDIVHKHLSGVTVGTFFDSLKLSTKPTALYVNGDKYAGEWQNYEVKNLDRVALSTTDLNKAQLALVSDKACIYSETCPERGKPPTENCVGGLETPCTVDEKS